MLNRVVLVGRLTKDPDLRYTPNGVAVASFTLAVNRTFTNQNGEREADFIAIVVWRKQAENAANYLKKGSLVGIDGRLRTRSYENGQGQRVYVTEVIADTVQYLEPRSSNSESAASPSPAKQKPKPNSGSDYDFDDPFADDGQTFDISDDDLPFL